MWCVDSTLTGEGLWIIYRIIVGKGQNYDYITIPSTMCSVLKGHAKLLAYPEQSIDQKYLNHPRLLGLRLQKPKTQVQITPLRAPYE